MHENNLFYICKNRIQSKKKLGLITVSINYYIVSVGLRTLWKINY